MHAVKALFFSFTLIMISTQLQGMDFGHPADPKKIGAGSTWILRGRAYTIASEEFEEKQTNEVRYVLHLVRTVNWLDGIPAAEERISVEFAENWYHPPYSREVTFESAPVIRPINPAHSD